MELLPVVAGFQLAFALLFLYLTQQRGDRSYLLFGLFALLSGIYYLIRPLIELPETSVYLTSAGLTALVGYYGIFPWYIREMLGSKINGLLIASMAVLIVTLVGALTADIWKISTWWPSVGHITIACIAVYITSAFYNHREWLDSPLHLPMAVAIWAFNLLFLHEVVQVYMFSDSSEYLVFMGLPLLDYYPILFTALMVHSMYQKSVERQQLELDLAHQTLRWQTLIDGLQVLVLKLDRNGTIETVNAFTHKYFPHEDWTGKHVSELLQKQVDIDEIVEHHGDFSATFNANGQQKEINWRPVAISTGNEHSVFLLGLDQTELQTANTRLKESVEKLNLLKEKLQKENFLLKQQAGQEELEGFVGDSSAMKYVSWRIRQIAPTNTTVLILGETGVGKDLVARAIHDLSERKDKPFIAVNCAAIPDTLLESELFGYRKGAFTGADTDKRGLFEMAHTGTVFLDEIGELPMELQAKLLRVIQDGQFTPLGAESHVQTDVRILAATNKDLLERSRQNQFRDDLYYRLSVYPITVVPLRNRKADIPALVEHFVSELSAKYNKEFVAIDSQTLEQLLKYNWPGNVRELANVIERAIIESASDVLEIHEDLVPMADLFTTEEVDTDLLTLDEHEKQYLVSVLEKCGWQISGRGGAAQILEIPPSTLRSRLKKHGIHRPVG